jgi:zinc protease
MKVKSKKEKVKNMNVFRKLTQSFGSAVFAFLLLPFAFLPADGQEQPPTPGAPRAAKVPAVVEKKLANGLTVATVERKNVPLITVHLLVNSGAEIEGLEKAGLANMTASLLTKGTKTKTASQIAEQIEFLGGSVNAGAGWDSSFVSINVMSDKLDQVMAILADVVINPTFKQEEIDLLKSQTLDGLAYNLKQPGFLANYVASRFTFNEHPVGGTPASTQAITRNDIVGFKKENYKPKFSVLIFTGDISPVRANTLAQKYLGIWKNPPEPKSAVIEKIVTMEETAVANANEAKPIVQRLLVIDLPNSGQASVSVTTKIYGGRINWDDKKDRGETTENYYSAIVMNSILGGGYSSRLNQEIRIKRGLSYGAGSGFGWRFYESNFFTRTQTKNESAAEVAELVLSEIRKLSENSVPETEIAPRKLVLTGDFGRDLETTGTLAARVAELYNFYLPTNEMNSYIDKVQSVTDAQIKGFAKQNLNEGDLIIVGDYSIFKDDLAKRFPNIEIEVIKADELDLSKENLRK